MGKIARFRITFKWYDLWVGAFWDRRNRVLYVCPLPTICLEFWFFVKDGHMTIGRCP